MSGFFVDKLCRLWYDNEVTVISFLLILVFRGCLVMKKILMGSLFVFAVFFLSNVNAEVTDAGTIIYVDDDSTAVDPNGVLWQYAFNNLNDAVAHAESLADEKIFILVAEGTYNVTSTINLTLTNKDFLHIFGGFEGVEVYPNLGSRDPVTHPTIIDGGDNTRLFYVNQDITCTIDGFIMSNGLAKQGTGGGGAMLIDASSPSISNCVFSSNTTGNNESGGAMFCDNGANPQIKDCTFEDNSADKYGGAIVNDANSNPVIENCDFINNMSVSRSGGAIGSLNFSDTVVKNCYFSGNNAVSGGAIFGYNNSDTEISGTVFYDNFCDQKGGAVYHEQMSAGKITNCKFLSNESYVHGGAVYTEDPGSDTLMVNCVFSGNYAAYDGGAVYNDRTGAEIINSSFWNNTADGQGGGVFNYFGTASAVNCVFWENTDEDGQEASSQITGGDYTYCCIMNYAGACDCGNTGADPLFADAFGPDATAGTEDDNLALTCGSGAVDNGNNDAVPAELLEDIAGNYRFMDDWFAENAGSPPNDVPYVDMGAYEFKGCPVEIQIITPEEGAMIEALSVIDIAWQTGGEVNSVELSYDDGSGWQLIDRPIENTGVYNGWKLPNVHYYPFKIRVADASDPNVGGDAEISVFKPDAVRIISPAEDEFFMAGNVYPVVYEIFEGVTAGEMTLEYSVYYRMLAWSEWQTIDTVPGGTGGRYSYVWTVADEHSRHCKLRLREVGGTTYLSDEFGIFVCDDSYLAGDFNNDCFVNMYDLAAIGKTWLLDSESVDFDSDCDPAEPFGTVDYEDMLVMAEQWLLIAHPFLPDFNKDGRIDNLDLQLFAQSWLSGDYIETLDKAEPTIGAQLGFSVDMDDLTAISGAWQDDGGRGYAVLWSQDPDGRWTNTQKVEGQLDDPNTYFGCSAAVYGDFAIVGAYGEDNLKGAAYILQNDGGNWGITQRLFDPCGMPDDFFGAAVDIGENYAIVGAYGSSDAAGAAYIYEKQGGSSWAPLKKIAAAELIADDQFGYSVAINDNYAVIGAYGRESGAVGEAGAAYLFGYDGLNSFVELDVVNDDMPEESDNFGFSVDIDGGDNVIIGCRNDNEAADGAGSASVYTIECTGECMPGFVSDYSLVLEQKLYAFDAFMGDTFGFSVSIDYPFAMVGAFNEGNGDGAVYLFEHMGGKWRIIDKLTDGQPGDNSKFGCDVSLRQLNSIIGAKFAGEDDSRFGSAIIYGPIDFPDADLIEDNYVDFVDFAEFGKFWNYWE